MKILQYDKKFRVTNDDKIKLSSNLKPDTYEVKVDMQGFYLEKVNHLTLGTSKIYGDSETKVDHILKGYQASSKSMGTILAGKKGIGKTLFAKILANKAIAQGLPVLLVNKGYQGIGKFIDSIKQGTLVLFDEFEKNFNNLDIDDQDANTSTESQATLLNLFDGISDQKRLYIITVNEIYNLNEYMLNRPGRFHYLIRLDFPSATEAKEYLQDNLSKEYYDQIPEIIKFIYRVPLNYDSLRAIVFEVNLGTPFKEAIKVLNIINTEERVYKLLFKFNSGYTYTEPLAKIDLFDQNVKYSNNDYSLIFNTNSLDIKKAPLRLSGEDVTLNIFEGSSLYNKTRQGASKDTLSQVLIIPVAQKDLGFSV